MKTYFRTKEVAQILGITERTIRFYLEEDLVHPELGDLGRGKVRRYTRRDIILFSFIRELANHGFKIVRIAHLLETLKNYSFYLDPDAHDEQDLKNPDKEWIDFFDINDLKDDTSRVYVVIHDISGEPVPLFSVLDNKEKSVILTVADMMQGPSVLIIDITGLFEKVSKL
jgi:DNA-binding transcriptional MerR regulator